MNITTKCVHSGTYFDKVTRGINTPVFTSSVFEYLGAEKLMYPRYFNIPNQRAVVEKLMDLEGCEDGLVLSSGMAAISATLVTFLKPGDATFGRHRGCRRPDRGLGPRLSKGLPRRAPQRTGYQVIWK